MLKFSTIHIDPIEQCRGFKKIRADTALQHNRIAAQQHKPDTKYAAEKKQNTTDDFLLYIHEPLVLLQ